MGIGALYTKDVLEFTVAAENSAVKIGMNINEGLATSCSI